MLSDDTRAVRDRFDARAASYDETAMHRDLAAEVARFVELADATHVLDIATGTGLVLRALRERGMDAHVELTGVDLSPGMLAVARSHLPDVTLVNADARRLPLDDDSVDLVVCVTGLHLIPEPELVFDEWTRVLRPGGHAVTATYSTFDPTRHHREAPARDPLPYALDHTPFATPAALSRTAGSRFRLRRHTTWSDGHDVILIADLEHRPTLSPGDAPPAES